MKVFNLSDFTRGWFVGGFEDGKSIIKTNEYEVAVKRYKKSEYDASHYHLEADEISCIISGKVLMNGIEYKDNDIILIEKGEATDYKPITDEVVSVVIKTKSIPNDKYMVNENTKFITCIKCNNKKEISMFSSSSNICKICDHTIVSNIF